MSVYTRLTKEELEQLLNRYDIGSFIEIEGINEGITNSNYFLTTSQNKYILTIFEEPDLNLNYAIELMDTLSTNGIKCPIPIKTKDGGSVLKIKEKPLSIFSLLPGKTITNVTPTIKMCDQIGSTIADIHLYSKKYSGDNNGLRDTKWFQKTSEKLNSVLDVDDINLINQEIKNQVYCENKSLPSGIIHSDLFRDNSMFIGDNLTGVIDFYYACNGYYLYDLAIIINDWCLNNDMSINIDRQNAIIKSYNKKREIEILEKQMWSKVLRHAALRFWLSRLHDKYFPTAGEITHQHDPNKFKSILIDRIKKNYELKI